MITSYQFGEHLTKIGDLWTCSGVLFLIIGYKPRASGKISAQCLDLKNGVINYYFFSNIHAYYCLVQRL